MREDGAASSDETSSAREAAVVRLLLAQPQVAEALRGGPAVQIRASGDLTQSSLPHFVATVEVNAGDAKAALRSVEQLSEGLGAIFLPDVLQVLAETRQFLGACFAKLSVGGVLAVTAPHQFLYERKLRLPSRRDGRHRRFFTANTLMAELEEAIDPCAFRLRLLADCDDGYDYSAAIEDAPAGAQDLVAVIEKIAPPRWRDALARDEIWAATTNRPARLVEIDRKAPAPVAAMVPDRRGVREIAVLKLDHRGDFLMASEAFTLLRQSFPAAEITLICGSWNVGEAAKLGLFAKIVPFDLFPEDDSARLEAPPRDLLIGRFAEEMRGTSYDLAIDLRLFDDTREVLQKIDARNRAGFDRYDSFPWLTIRLNVPSGTENDRTEVEYLAAERFATSNCRHLGFEICNDYPSGPQLQTLVWGPYAPLKAGHYRFECFIEPLGQDFDLPFNIATDAGREILTVGTLRVARGRRPEILLTADRSHHAFEFRLYAQPGYDVLPFRFFGLKYTRTAPMRGPHQSEAMALLAHLAALRLRDAYTVETL